MREAEIVALDPDAPEVRSLLADSDRFYAALYPAESNHLESADDLKADNVIFVGCRVETQLAASGAMKIVTDAERYAEIKRVYVVEACRGQGLSRAIMRHLEDEALARNIGICRLETGVRQPQALGLYRALGYVERGPFGDYREDPLSVFMEKRLGGDGR